jgi:hypothetical protein
MTKGIDIVDVNVLEGEWRAEKPVIIIDAATAQKVIEKGMAAELLKQGIAALALTGKRVVYAELDE